MQPRAGRWDGSASCSRHGGPPGKGFRVRETLPVRKHCQAALPPNSVRRAAVLRDPPSGAAFLPQGFPSPDPVSPSGSGSGHLGRALLPRRDGR